MNKSVFSISVSFIMFVLSLLLLTWPCGASETKDAAEAADPNAKSADVVATIADYSITREELVQRFLQEVRPRDEEFPREGDTVTVEGVLRRMLAERAMSLEGRRLGRHETDPIRSNIVQFEQQQLVGKLLGSVLDGKLNVEESEIERVMKENPKADREQAVLFIQRSRATQLMERFYHQLTQERKLEKNDENIARAVQVHDRLLNRPVEPRDPRRFWILNSQLNTDMSDEERGLVLATYEGGQLTLRDWFVALCNIAPPRRPRDLGQPKGVERLLDMALRAPVLAAEARSRGYDKDPELRSAVRALEDQRLLYAMMEEKTKDVEEPTPEEVKAEFEKDPERFAIRGTLKVDQIWCPDPETARKIKELLDEGADFQELKKEHCSHKDIEFYHASRGTEGPFWAEVSKGEPNDVIGPIRGFYDGGVQWRFVKILEKTPAQVQEYSESLGNSVKWAIFADRRRQALREYEDELLEKYPHEIFRDRIEGLDPLEVATTEGDD